MYGSKQKIKQNISHNSMIKNLEKDKNLHELISIGSINSSNNNNINNTSKSNLNKSKNNQRSSASGISKIKIISNSSTAITFPNQPQNISFRKTIKENKIMKSTELKSNENKNKNELIKNLNLIKSIKANKVLSNQYSNNNNINNTFTNNNSNIMNYEYNQNTFESELLKVNNEMLEYQLKCGRLTNNNKILEEKVKNLDQLLKFKENEAELFKTKYDNYINQYKDEIEQLSKKINDNKKNKLIYDKMYSAFKSLLNKFLDIIEILLFVNGSNQNTVNNPINANTTNILLNSNQGSCKKANTSNIFQTLSKFESSIDIYENSNINCDDDKKNILVTQIRDILVSKLKFYKMNFPLLNFDKEIEKVNGWTSNCNLGNQNNLTSNNYQHLYSANSTNNNNNMNLSGISNIIKNSKLDNNLTINDNSINSNDFDLSVSAAFYNQSPKFNNFFENSNSNLTLSNLGTKREDNINIDNNNENLLNENMFDELKSPNTESVSSILDFNNPVVSLPKNVRNNSNTVTTSRKKVKSGQGKCEMNNVKLNCNSTKNCCLNRPNNLSININFTSNSLNKTIPYTSSNNVLNCSFGNLKEATITLNNSQEKNSGDCSNVNINNNISTAEVRENNIININESFGGTEEKSNRESKSKNKETDKNNEYSNREEEEKIIKKEYSFNE